MFATISKIEARVEDMQGEEQSKIREALKDYPTSALISEVIEVDSSILLEEVVKSTIIKFNGYKMRLVELDKSRLQKNANYSAVNAEMQEVKKDFVKYISDTLDANLNGAEWQKFENKLIDFIMSQETELFKQAKESV